MEQIPGVHGTAYRLSFASVYRAFVFLAALCVVVAGLRAVSTVMAPMLVALFIAGIVIAPFRWLRQRGVSKPIAFAVVGVFVIGAITATVFLSMHWSRTLAERWPEYRDQLQAAAIEAANTLANVGVQVTPDDIRDAVDTRMIRNVSGSVFRIVTGATAVLVLTGFVFADLVALPDKLGPALAEQPRLQAVARNTVTRLLAYFRIKTATSFSTGVLAGLSCAVVGLELATLWGFLAFVLNYVTTIGSILAAIPPLLLALATLGVTEFVILGLAYLTINMGIGAVLEPKLLGDKMDLSPLVVLLSLAFWGWVLGPFGMLLAVQITMLAKIVFEQTDALRPVAMLLGSRREARRYWAEHARAPETTG